MKFKSAAIMTAIGVGGIVLYSQIKNGNMAKMMQMIKPKAKDMLNDLEDMM